MHAFFLVGNQPLEWKVENDLYNLEYVIRVLLSCAERRGWDYFVHNRSIENKGTV